MTEENTGRPEKVDCIVNTILISSVKSNFLNKVVL